MKSPCEIRPEFCVLFLLTFLLSCSTFHARNIGRHIPLFAFSFVFEFVAMKKKSVQRVFRSYPALERATFCILISVLASMLTAFHPLATLTLDGIPAANPNHKVSIVIPSRFEQNYIVQTVMYVFQDTPPDILHEVVLVDDNSEFPVAPLVVAALQPDGMLNFLTATQRSKIIVVRNEQQEGLIRGKIQGGNIATGTHIFFLDGHCRSKPGYMEHLLHRIDQGTYKRIVVPSVIDVNGTDWSFTDAVGTKMMFTWNFAFDWFDDGTDEVPIMSGGLLLMTKRFWDETGYDEGMLDWGGENIEQSIHAWLCGGDILVERVSLVGHIFNRPAPPNKVRQYQVEKNQARAAYAWLDDYYDVFADAQPTVKTFENFGLPMEPMILKRMADKCRPFTDFMARFQEVFERRALFIKIFHHLQDVTTGLCLTGIAEKDVSKPHLSFETCRPSNTLQQWASVSHGRRLLNRSAVKCLDSAAAAADGSKMAIMFACDFGINQNQNWSFTGDERARSNHGSFESNGHIQKIAASTGGGLQPLHPMGKPTSVCIDQKGHVNTCETGLIFRSLW
eukprot:GEMP01013756.1.p1 GENE.GEMP01013756.1~~GEMP01013756.1.p1  ORF type:complete len:562 (-),score=70.71 GEMP01013756.1:1308-2993(-)